MQQIMKEVYIMLENNLTLWLNSIEKKKGKTEVLSLRKKKKSIFRKTLIKSLTANREVLINCVFLQLV